MRGTAEYLAAKLGPGHSCKHFPKSRVGKAEWPFPSRLGFFHESDESISYVETSKLCENCCRDAVPEGYNAWLTLCRTPEVASLRHAQNEQDGSRNGVDTTLSQKFYPPIFQAGTEGFPSDSATDNPASIRVEPKEIPMPQDSETENAWLWLKGEGKPFYIDQLHLVRKWSTLIAKSAERDGKIAMENGTVYDGRATKEKAEPRSISKEVASPIQTVAENPQLKLDHMRSDEAPKTKECPQPASPVSKYCLTTRESKSTRHEPKLDTAGTALQDTSRMQDNKRIDVPPAIRSTRDSSSVGGLNRPIPVDHDSEYYQYPAESTLQSKEDNATSPLREFLEDAFTQQKSDSQAMLKSLPLLGLTLAKLGANPKSPRERRPKEGPSHNNDSSLRKTKAPSPKAAQRNNTSPEVAKLTQQGPCSPTQGSTQNPNNQVALMSSEALQLKQPSSLKHGPNQQPPKAQRPAIGKRSQTLPRLPQTTGQDTKKAPPMPRIKSTQADRHSSEGLPAPPAMPKLKQKLARLDKTGKKAMKHPNPSKPLGHLKTSPSSRSNRSTRPPSHPTRNGSRDGPHNAPRGAPRDAAGKRSDPSKAVFKDAGATQPQLGPKAAAGSHEPDDKPPKKLVSEKPAGRKSHSEQPKRSSQCLPSNKTHDKPNNGSHKAQNHKLGHGSNTDSSIGSHAAQNHKGHKSNTDTDTDTSIGSHAAQIHKGHKSNTNIDTDSSIGSPVTQNHKSHKFNTDTDSTIGSPATQNHKGHKFNTDTDFSIGSHAAQNHKGHESNTNTDSTIGSPAAQNHKGHESNTNTDSSIGSPAAQNHKGHKSNTDTDSTIGSPAAQNHKGHESNTNTDSTIGSSAAQNHKGHESNFDTGSSIGSPVAQNHKGHGFDTESHATQNHKLGQGSDRNSGYGIYSNTEYDLDHDLHNDFDDGSHDTPNNELSSGSHNVYEVSEDELDHESENGQHKIPEYELSRQDSENESNQHDASENELSGPASESDYSQNGTSEDGLSEAQKEFDNSLYEVPDNELSEPESDNDRHSFFRGGLSDTSHGSKDGEHDTSDNEPNDQPESELDSDSDSTSNSELDKDLDEGSDDESCNKLSDQPESELDNDSDSTSDSELDKDLEEGSDDEPCNKLSDQPESELDNDSDSASNSELDKDLEEGSDDEPYNKLSDQPESDQPESDQPESDQPESDQPESELDNDSDSASNSELDEDLDEGSDDRADDELYDEQEDSYEGEVDDELEY